MLQLIIYTWEASLEIVQYALEFVVCENDFLVLHEQNTIL